MIDQGEPCDIDAMEESSRNRRCDIDPLSVVKPKTRCRMGRNEFQGLGKSKPWQDNETGELILDLTQEENPYNEEEASIAMTRMELDSHDDFVGTIAKGTENDTA
ncbi:hypothetical protein Tco_0827837 [Tanacetum coccineum]